MKDVTKEKEVEFNKMELLFKGFRLPPSHFEIRISNNGTIYYKNQP